MFVRPLAGLFLLAHLGIFAIAYAVLLVRRALP
jgi:hypothetical protein